MPTPRPRQLLTADGAAVAPTLLGWRLTHESPSGVVTVVITEVEAYQGPHDPASHAYRGRTARNEVMFGAPGHLYVYRSHGLHWCCNVVTGRSGEASAVLLRAGRVVEGADVAQRRRGERVPAAGLARGPGCLCQALDIDGRHNGVDLLRDRHLRLIPDPSGEPSPAATVVSGPRVGVSRAHEVKWRFWIDGEPSVSAYRRSKRAPQGD